jgi:hypothetical protein
VPFDATAVDLKEAAYRVLRLPAVADKSFLITIGDRSVGGLTARDQMVGPWQVACADVAVTLMAFHGYLGEAFAIGERAPLAVIDAPASGRMAVGEALTNLVAADVATLGDVKLSANWMAAAGFPGEDARLFDTVRAVSDFCQQIGVAIPVGKDSLSMRTGLAGRRRRRARPKAGGLAAVADRHRLRARAGCAPDADAATGARCRRNRPPADRPRRGRNRLGGFGAGAGVSRHRQRRPRCRRSGPPRPPSSPPSANSPPTICCSPTTTAPTAGCSPPSAKWPLPPIAAFRSTPTVCATTR